uniref:PurE domain-containing protein n=1 Tax=Panagrolaimus sp. ES5 TaxID=591445 RepID=A0AC34GR09_9BILA
MKETLIDDGDSYINRDFFNDFMMILRNNTFGLTSIEGEEWVEQRKFAIKTFHRLGMGKNIMQEKMFIELSRMFEDIDEDIQVAGSNNINIAPFVETCVASIIYSILFDYQITRERKSDYIKMKTIVYEYTELFGHWAVQMIMAKPYLFKDIPFFKRYMQKIHSAYWKMSEHVEMMASDAIKNYKRDMDSEANDYVTAFLRQYDATDGEKGYNPGNLNSILVDFYIAGQDTTINSIMWGIIYLTYEPKIIEKMQKEMDQKLGDQEFVGIDDKIKLPYTTAVTHELQRMANVMPQNIARRTTKDVVIGGYNIKEGTTIMPLMSAVLYDERIFPNHLKFDPTRFLSPDEKSVKRVDELIPFSCGRRMCLGAEMAKMEIFLIFANLFRHYDISMPSTGIKPSLHKNFGLTTKPEEFKCFIRRRKQKENMSESKLLAEGKTKQIFSHPADDENGAKLVLVRSRDTLTAFNAKRKDEVEGKAEYATKTTINVFKYLNELGCPTHFIREGENDTEFIAQDCAMIPIEWVARRIATGSYLKRNPGVPEGFVFKPLKIETFFKDDENDDPQWSDEQLLSAKFEFNKRKLTKVEISWMKRLTDAIFCVLEKAWRNVGCALVDMKVEFGVTSLGQIVLADVIDNDSWRVWPGGDKRLQLDKQFYRDLKEVTSDALAELKKNYEKVSELTKEFIPKSRNSRLVIMAGSGADKPYIDEAALIGGKYGIANIQKRISSAHKSTTEALEMLAEYEDGTPTVIICIAGRSNGLGPVMSANSTLPVINAPNVGPDWAAQDIWSSLRMPTGVGCTTVLNSSEAALAAAKILSLNDHIIFGRVLFSQLSNIGKIFEADQAMNNHHH